MRLNCDILHASMDNSGATKLTKAKKQQKKKTHQPPKHEATAAIRKLSTTDGPAFSLAANERMVKIPVPNVVERPVSRREED